MSGPQQPGPHQSEWDHDFQRYLRTLWSEQYGRYVRWSYNQVPPGTGAWLWEIFDYPPIEQTGHRRKDSAYGTQKQAAPGASVKEGGTIRGTYGTGSKRKYEKLDPDFKVRGRAFFEEGIVIAVLFTDAAGNTTTKYNDSISLVRYGERVHTQIRRFVIVGSKRGHSYGCPIYTYSGKATLKPGVDPQEHAIVYSEGTTPSLLEGEDELNKRPICVVMERDEPLLTIDSRIYFGIVHPIQHNVKVKHIGKVQDADIPDLLGYWRMEMAGLTNDASQDIEVDPHIYDPESNKNGYDPNKKPHMYHPEFNPFGYHPEHNPTGFHPEHHRCAYHPMHNRYGYHDEENPHGYHPTLNEQGFHPEINKHIYHPDHNEHGYHTLHNPQGYHPVTSRHSFHPVYNPYGWHSKKAPFCYHERYNLAGYHDKDNPYGYHPDSNVEGYHPTENPHGFHHERNPYGFHSTFNPEGYHPEHNSEAYHPTYNTARTVVTHNEEVEEDDDDDDDNEDEYDDSSEESDDEEEQDEEPEYVTR